MSVEEPLGNTMLLCYHRCEKVYYNASRPEFIRETYESRDNMQILRDGDKEPQSDQRINDRMKEKV